MPIRTYQLYFNGAAAQGVANTPVVAKGDVLAVLFNNVTLVNNGVAWEVSCNVTRQYGTNGAQGIIAIGDWSVITGGVCPLSTTISVPIPAGCSVKPGDSFYLHGTQIGSAGSGTCSAIIYVRE